MDILEVLRKRYSAKEFDPKKALSPRQLEQLEDLLCLAPSSTNLQPWQFILATTPEGKSRVAKAAHGVYENNRIKILEASAVVVFATLTQLDDAYLQKLLRQEEADGRFADQETKEQSGQARQMFTGYHTHICKDFGQWSDKQVHLNLGNFLLGVAALGLDAIAIEGVDTQVLDEEFGLNEQGYRASIVVPVGFAKESDFNRTLPKSRWPKAEIIRRV